MKLSYRTLHDYVDFDLTPAELADKLTMAGLEVEEIETLGKIPDGVVVAKILSRSKHENSDHLSICKVDAGNEILQIVCGAPNCDAGSVVPLARIGTVFPDGESSFTIRKSKIRGAESFGMMCSERELGLSDDHGGLMILPQDWKLGAPLQAYVPTDTVYTVEITPNRPDWLSYYGVARDIAALTGGALHFPKIEDLLADSGPYMDFVSVEAPELCPCYKARRFTNVRIQDSPDWLKNALRAVGIRPINNIVDITNFVMMELGCPLHAFDVRNLAGGRIVVRRAAPGETIVALDGQTYDLSTDDLVIADSEKPVAIAGVMGGEYSGVMPDTTEVVLESAWFDPASVRATSRRLGLSTDASYRYERGVDRGIVDAAGKRAAELIITLAGGRPAGWAKAEEPMPSPRIIDMKYERIRSLLGMEVPNARIDEILVRLGFERVRDSASGSSFAVPTWRALDVKEAADLAEEVARIHGLDKLPDVPIKATQADFEKDAFRRIEELRTQLASAGLFEIVSVSMLDEAGATKDGVFEPSDLIRMSNPISSDLAVMRPSLLPGLLNAVRYNVSRKNPNLGLFEIGRAFCANPAKFPEERDELALAVTGCVHPERYSSERCIQLDFFDLKGVLEAILMKRRLADYEFVPTEDPRFVRTCCAKLLIDGKEAGVLGEVAPNLTKGMRLNSKLFVAIVQLSCLFSAKERSPYYVPVSLYPSVTRDIAFLAPSSMTNRQVLDFVAKEKIPFLESASIFDVFEGEALGPGRKSLAYSFVFRSSERTLTDDEVNALYEKLRRRLAEGLNVELR